MSKKTLEQAKEKWQQHSCRAEILYQWVREDAISFDTFEQLLEYRREYHERQMQLDMPS